MKRKYRNKIRVFTISAFLCLAFFMAEAQDNLRNAFVNPSIDAHPGLYWYWMNGNISKEGILADMKAMNDVGVKWVYLMDIGLHPQGKVVNRSKDWYDMVKTALTEAGKYNINVHVASPGWAVSGGPWVTPEKSMKELVWTDTHIKGGGKMSVSLQQPATKEFYKEIAVLAFPAPRGDKWGTTKDLKPVVVDMNGKEISISDTIFDGNYNTRVRLPAMFEVVFPKPHEVRSIRMRSARGRATEVTVYGFDKSTGSYINLGKLNPKSAGPFSAVLSDLTFNAMKTDRFRFRFNGETNIEELEFYGSVRMPDWQNKAGFGTVTLTEKYTGEASRQNVMNTVILPKWPVTGEADRISKRSIINLTDKMTPDGNLEWNAPEGEWIVQRFGYTSTGVKIFPPPVGGDGLEVDKMNKEATDLHYKNAIKALLEAVGDEAAKAVAFHHIDSYESGWQNWTEGFDKEFSQRCGYGLIDFLPAMTGRIVDNPTVTEGFYWDLRRVISDLFIENHYGRMAENGRKDGLRFSNEPYDGPFDYLKLGAVADLPMVEFWIPATQPQDQRMYFEGVYAGRTNGKKVIASETYTSESPSERWNHYPYNLKATGDYIYCSGVNRFIMHVSAHQPFIGEHTAPGMTCGINGIHYDRNNTWWYHGAKEWNEYLSRCQAMLQEGMHVADALYFQGSEAPSKPKWFDPELPQGYDLDACDETVFLRLKVIEGKVVLPSGKSYQYLVLPAHGWLTSAAIVKAAELVENGATLIGCASKSTPSLSETIKNDPKRTVAYRKLWSDNPGSSGNKIIGKGRVIWGSSFQEILHADKLIPDFDYDKDAGLLINYIHKVTDNNEFYFVANGNNMPGRVTCRFRVEGDMVPQFWHPDNGTIENCVFYTRGEGYVEIPVYFDPAGSVFVVFGKPAAKRNHIVSITRNGVDIASETRLTTDIEVKAGTILSPIIFKEKAGVAYGEFLKEGQYQLKNNTGKVQNVDIKKTEPVKFINPWVLQFPVGWGAPEKVVLDQLISLSEHANDGVKYFSGTVSYNTSVNIPSGNMNRNKSIYLDLGEVNVIAEVIVNGKNLGTFWKPPFMIDITSAAKQGKNNIQINVTNLWANRMIGDEQYPSDINSWGMIREWPEWLLKNEPRPEPRRLTFSAISAWRKSDALPSSGLIGPVEIKVAERVTIDTH